MSSEIFESREEDLRGVLEDVKSKVGNQASRVEGEERKKLVRDAEKKLEDARSLLREMESEMKKAPAPYRSEMMSKLRGYKREVEQINREVIGLGTGRSARQNVTFDTEDDFESMESAQRARLFAGHEILTRTSDSIARSQQISAETDVIGHGITEELGTQREQLERTRDRLTDTDNALVQSRKILKGMARRVMTNKLILIVIILMEILVLGGLVYWKFFS